MKYFIVLLVLTVQQLSAQSFVIKGSLAKQSDEPVTNATISLYKQFDSTLYKVALSNAEGKFEFRLLPSSKYYFIAKAVGLSPYRSDVLELNENISLPPVKLLIAVEQLKTVEVVARKPLVEVMSDKTVFNVEGSLAATGLSAFDMLRKAPGVMVDNQNTLIVEGKAGARVYIDGKVSLLSGDDLVNYLKTLQSTDIEAIEIITQPSAKYDAAGTAGIINLRLKKNKNYGTNGSIKAGYAIGIFNKYNAALSLNHRNARFNVYSNFSSSVSKNRNYLNFYRFQNGYEYDQRSFYTSDDKNYNLRAGLNYTSNAKSSFGIIVSGNFNASDNNGQSRTPIKNSSTGAMEQLLDASGASANRNQSISTNLNYRYADKSRKELLIDADYGYYNSDRDNIQPNTYRDFSSNAIISENTFHMITPVDIQLLSIKGDYMQPIGKIALATGIKSSLVQTNNIFNFFDVKQNSEVYNSNRSNQFNYNENINAMYVNISKTGQRTSYQVGLRAEQTISNGKLKSQQQNKNSQVKRNYVDLFPSGGITYKANDKNSLAMNYSRRIQRPDYRSLNPFEYNIDELSFGKGNPYLQPQYTQTVKITHTYKYVLSTGLSYSYISNFFAQITDTAGTNRNYISPQNIANQQVLNLSISYPFNISKWWNVYSSVNVYRSSYAATNPKYIPINQNSLSLYAQNTFNLPKGYRFELGGWYSSPSIWAGTYRTKGLGSLDVAMQKNYLSNALSLRIALSDVFNSSNWKGTTQFGTLFIRGSGGYESRQLRLSLAYNFGKNTVKAAVDKKSGAEEEKGRIQ